LHVHDLDTYENARLFLSEDGESGFALIGDEIGSFFSGGRGQAYPTLRLAVNEGGRRIDTYRTKLPSVMGKAHFRPVARVEFNAELATPLWDKSKFKQFQNGKPDLVFYAYDPSFNVSGNKDAGDLATSEAPLVEYDEAVILQKEAVKKEEKMAGEAARLDSLEEQLNQLRADIAQLFEAMKGKKEEEMAIETRDESAMVKKIQEVDQYQGKPNDGGPQKMSAAKKFTGAPVEEKVNLGGLVKSNKLGTTMSSVLTRMNNSKF
jgi:acyl carrier protein phosphodiesterase